MDSYLVILQDLKNFHVDSQVITIAFVSFLMLYSMTVILVNFINIKKYEKISIISFVPLFNMYKVGFLSFNGYVGVFLIFLPFFAFLSGYYFPPTISRLLFVFTALFNLLCFIRLIIISYNLSLNKETIDDKGLIANDFVVTFSKDRNSGEEVISIKDMNDIDALEEEDKEKDLL